MQTIVGNVESSATQKEAMLTTVDERRRILLEANAHDLAQDMALSEAAVTAAALEAYLASPDVILSEWSGERTKQGSATDVWPPKKVDTPRTMKQSAIEALGKEERKKLAAAWCTSKLHAKNIVGGGSGSARGSTNTICDEAIGIFGDDAVLSKPRLNKLVKFSVGSPPPKIGRSLLVPAHITTGIVDYHRVLAAYKVPSYH